MVGPDIHASGNMNCPNVEVKQCHGQCQAVQEVGHHWVVGGGSGN